MLAAGVQVSPSKQGDLEMSVSVLPVPSFVPPPLNVDIQAIYERLSDLEAGLSRVDRTATSAHDIAE